MAEFQVPVLKAEGSIERLTLNGEANGTDAYRMREAVGGWLQVLNVKHPATGDVIKMWLDEEGKFKDPIVPNEIANALVSACNVGLMPGDFISGNVVLTGTTWGGDEVGEVTAPLPEAWESLINRLAENMEDNA